MTSEKECEAINRNEIVSIDSGFMEPDNCTDAPELQQKIKIVPSLELQTVENTITEEEDDESVEGQEKTVTNLKTVFETLPVISPIRKDPNWWIKERNEQEYLDYSHNQRKPSQIKSNFGRNASTISIHSDVDSDNSTVHTDKISTNKTDSNVFYSTDSSSSDEENVAEKRDESLAASTEVTENIVDVDEGKEAEEETHDHDTVSLYSLLSNKSTSQNGMMINVEALPEKNQRQLVNVIQELIQTERNYVNNLGKGVDTYVKVMDVKAASYPELLGKKYHIFGNIERLYYFHKDELLPSLIACEEDIMRIADLFYTFITKDYFYGYILFGINKPRAERLTIKYKKFFDEITKESEDRLGINSFLLQPIQILPRYKLLFGEVIKALANDIERIKIVQDVISACCIAEKQIQRLLDTVNEALSLNDIEETYEFDILDHGKFKKMGVFTIFEVDSDKKYKGKAFLFEYTMLVTEFIEKSTRLQYRTLINLDDILFLDTDNKDGFRIITMNKREIEFHADFLKVQEWIKALTSIDGKGNSRPKDIQVRNCTLLSRTGSNATSRTVTESNVSSFARSKCISSTMRVTKREKQMEPPRVESVFSNTSIKSNRSSTSSQDSYDLGNTTWNERKYLESLKNIEKHYIFLLQIHKKGYLDDLPRVIADSLNEFISVYDTILDYHTEYISPEIQKNSMDINFVCNLWTSCLKDPHFMIYKKYAILAPIAYEILSAHYLTSVSQGGDSLDGLDRSALQSLEYFVEIPIRHLQKYRKILNKMLKVLINGIEQQKDYPMELMRTVAVVQVKVSSFEKNVSDSFKIHSKKSYAIKTKDLGMILHSDLVYMEYSETPRHRIFLMETAVLAVRIKTDTNDESDETFETFIWSLPYGMVEYRHSVKKPERIKIYSKVAKYPKHSVIFRSLEKKIMFLKELEDIMKNVSGFTTYVNN